MTTKPTAEVKQALVDHISNPEFVKKAAIEGAQDQDDMLAKATAEVSVEEIIHNIRVKALNVWKSDGFDEREKALEALDTVVRETINNLIQAHTTALKGRVEQALPDLVDKHFPKGETKERGKATMLGGDIIKAITNIT